MIFQQDMVVQDGRRKQSANSLNAYQCHGFNNNKNNNNNNNNDYHGSDRKKSNSFIKSTPATSSTTLNCVHETSDSFRIIGASSSEGYYLLIHDR